LEVIDSAGAGAVREGHGVRSAPLRDGDFLGKSVQLAVE
jgi:hypothetical protein